MSFSAEFDVDEVWRYRLQISSPGWTHLGEAVPSTVVGLELNQLIFVTQKTTRLHFSEDTKEV